MISVFLNQKKYLIIRYLFLLVLFLLVQPLVFGFAIRSVPVEKDSTDMVMKKAIAQAAENRMYSNENQTKIYYKETIHIQKVSGLFNKLLTSKDEPPLKKGDILIYETTIQHDGIADSSMQTVLSSEGSFPQKIKSFDLERLTEYDIYNDSCNFISPLSSITLQVYRFHLEKIFQNSFGEKTFRIQVIPKHKNPYAFSGYIDILDSVFQVHAFSLSAKMNYGVASFSFTIKKEFGKSESNISADTCDVDGKMKTAGFKADINLSAYFLNNYKQSKDTTYLISEKPDKSQGLSNSEIINSIDSIHLKQKHFSYGFKYLDEILTLNPVDGFKIKLGGYFNWEFKNQTVWHNSAAVGYSFSQKQIPFFVSTGYEYLPQKKASVFLSGGRENTDFNAVYGVHPILNLMATLFVKENYNYLYGRTHVGIEHKIEAFNGFDTRVSFSYEQRTELHNKNDYSFFYRKTKSYPPNIPNNQYVIDKPEFIKGGNAALLEIELSYTPQRRYQFENRKKIFLYSDFPTFSILWKKGIPHFLESNTDFDYLQFSIYQKIRKNVMRNFTYSFSGGWFPNNKKMHFSEFRHFPVSGFTETLGGFGEMYHTIPVYHPSTNEWMLSGFFKYEALYLAIKYIPWINKTHMTESLYFSYLNTPYTRNLMEIGYSLNNILLFVNAGFFVGFENFRYSSWSFKIAFSMPEI
jgi:hypothetical protein